ncbi:SRPBCC family protein [Actinokineospora sp. PR83]|uniref:SRPBCC family protein n=1 Tax=Actinokineospora sp. PR83 TaxID=2884908 RepID=UPI001F4858A5|nr:SRPBCC family protein [Actinokineospora sp. PR83]MCG8914360.1 SRPBCC family protein [Actinokineospora sp. PR83]
MAAKQVSDTRVITTTPEVIFALLADPAQHPVIDGSGTVTGARPGSQRLALGSKFGMDMKMGLPYKIQNTVVEYEEGSRIAWRHFMGHRWRWQLEDLGDGTTRVTETFDWSTAKAPFVIELAKFPAKNLKGIRATLDRLEEMFPGSA